MMKSMSTSLFSKSDASPFRSSSNRASKVGTGCGRALPSSMGYLGFRGLTPQATQLTELTQLTQGAWDGIIWGHLSPRGWHKDAEKSENEQLFKIMNGRNIRFEG